MRTPLIAGNWKMNKTSGEAVDLARAVAAGAASAPGADLAVFPVAVHLAAVAAALAGSRVTLGGQDCHTDRQGAFTGSVSAWMLADAGCTRVIVGHSERRHGLGESDDLVGRKARAALDAGVRPILCVGETLAERQAGRSREVALRQLRAGLAHVRPAESGRVEVAYEPVWAIGTGVVAAPPQVVEMHEALRSALGDLLGAAGADGIRILYGGSVTPQNAATLLALPSVDGALVGGASLAADSFLAIARAVPAR